MCVCVHTPWHMCVGQRTTCMNWFFPPREKTEAIKLGGKCLYLLTHLTGLYFSSRLMCPRIASSLWQYSCLCFKPSHSFWWCSWKFTWPRLASNLSSSFTERWVYGHVPPCPAPWLLFISFHALYPPQLSLTLNIDSLPSGLYSANFQKQHVWQHPLQCCCYKTRQNQDTYRPNCHQIPTRSRAEGNRQVLKKHWPNFMGW